MEAWYSESDSCAERFGQPSFSHLMYAHTPHSSDGGSSIVCGGFFVAASPTPPSRSAICRNHDEA